MSDQPPPPPGQQQPPPPHQQPPGAMPPPPNTYQPTPGFPPAQPTPGFPAANAAPTSNGMATAALIVGIGSLVLFWACGLGLLGGITAVILGVVGLGRSKTLPGQPGRGASIAGIVLGALAAVAAAVLLVFVLAIGDTDWNFNTGNNGGGVTTENEDGGINSDPSDGMCDPDRFMQDPDC